MLNNTNNNQRVEINTPATGIIQKATKDSFFLRFHQNSQMALDLFKPKPKQDGKPIEILQIMLINDSFLIAECVFIEDSE